MKITAVAPSNIAFIKYWGKKDEVLRLPENGSVSMCLSNLLTTTTVEFSKDYKNDEVKIDMEDSLFRGNDRGGGDNKRQILDLTGEKESDRVIKHLERIKKMAGTSYKAKVITKNNFPTGTGLSSSASGFAALSLAVSKAAGLDLSEKEMSILARQGSGSACRSIPSGFVEWLDGDTSDMSYAESIFPPSHWEICDVVVVVSKEKKEIPTTEGQKLTDTSIFFPVRLKNIKNKISKIKNYIEKRKFMEFGELVEAEALELHAIMLTSQPSLIYLMPNSLLVMKSVKKWRDEGLECYFTVNTGQDVHIIIEKKNVSLLLMRLKDIEAIKQVIVNEPGEGARIIEEHLF